MVAENHYTDIATVNEVPLPRAKNIYGSCTGFPVQAALLNDIGEKPRYCHGTDETGHSY